MIGNGEGVSDWDGRAADADAAAAVAVAAYMTSVRRPPVKYIEGRETNSGD